MVGIWVGNMSGEAVAGGTAIGVLALGTLAADVGHGAGVSTASGAGEGLDNVAAVTGTVGSLATHNALSVGTAGVRGAGVKAVMRETQEDSKDAYEHKYALSSLRADIIGASDMVSGALALVSLALVGADGVAAAGVGRARVSSTPGVGGKIG